MANKFHSALDHLTDLAGIGALTVLAFHTDPSNLIVGAITTIALGKQYAKHKWGK